MQENEPLPARHDLLRRDWIGTLLMAVALLLMLGAPTLTWLFRGELEKVGPQAFTSLWHGAGGLTLLYLAAGLPIGATLLAAALARIFPSAARAGRVLLPLLAIQVAYFTYHGVAVFRYSGAPFLAFAGLGYLFVLLFVALVVVWARKRTRLEASRHRSADLLLGAGLCFFTSAWQTCGLAGAPGFAAYPDMVLKLRDQSLIVGQLVAIQFFAVLGFVFLLLAMRAEQVKDREDGHD